MSIADNYWMKSISVRRRDLGLGALALGAAATPAEPAVQLDHPRLPAEQAVA